MSLSDNYTDTPPNPDDTPATILSPITKALKDNNITLDRLAGKLNTLLDCQRTVGTDKDGQTIETPDNPSQLKAVDLSAKLSQAYPAEQHDVRLLGDTEMTLAVLVYREQENNSKPLEKPKIPKNITTRNDTEKTTSPTGGRPDKQEELGASNNVETPLNERAQLDHA